MGTLFITCMLALYGAGLAVGNTLSGRFADCNLTGTLVVSLLGTAILLTLFSVTMKNVMIVPPLIFLWDITSPALR